MIKDINWLELIIGGSIGFFFALLTAAIYEWVRKPNLIFEVDKNANEGQRRIKNHDYRWKFLNVIIQNERRSWWQSWFYGNVPAENTRAWVSFCDYDSNAEILNISARWASTKQPINDFGRPDWSSILVTSRESIPVGESASLAIVIKTDKSGNVFAFNNESYLFYPEYSSPYDTLWSNPDFQVGDDKKYKVCIKVLSQGHEYSEKFTLLNSSRSYKSIILSREKSECS